MGYTNGVAYIILGILALLPAPVLGQTANAAPTVFQLRADLAGEWMGALGYRDYQSNKLFELPVATSIRSLDDGLTQIRVSKFDEGPRQAPVWITTVSLDDVKASTVTSAIFRAGRVPELLRDTVTLLEYTDKTHWKIVYSQQGRDDDKPADIRVIETRNGDELLSVKEVRPVGTSSPWKFRNQTRLTKAVPDARP